ncbi:hypothetical protein [Candidatus Rhabdochlamydia porcellionis]|nr:hypothetical protein [Candidatus Rhabdochlamydia porcellionis]
MLIYPDSDSIKKHSNLSDYIKIVIAPNEKDAENFDLFSKLISKSLEKALPDEFMKDFLKNPSQEKMHSMVLELRKKQPLISWDDPHKAPCFIRMSLICASEFTTGIGRYFCDILSRWLIPGKLLNISCSCGANIVFHCSPKQIFYFHQIYIDIVDSNDLMLLKGNISSLQKEIYLNILAVRYARRVISIKNLSAEQKRFMIKENIASSLNRSAKELDSSMFNLMHNLFLQLNVEKKISRIQLKFAPFLKQKVKIFDRDIFEEIRYYSFLFGSRFTAARELRHLVRLVSFQYLFRKNLLYQLAKNPEKRHLNLKIFRAYLSSNSTQEHKPVLGIIGGINVLKESELFEERHILEAIRHCLPNASKVENSFILDRRTYDPIRLFYLEIEKKDNTPFTIDEIKELRKSLNRELKENIESIIHPVLMPRNEEEIMRSIVLLSRQLKYVNDLPQVTISFSTQTKHQLIFTIILLRVLNDSSPDIVQLFSKANTLLKIERLEVKSAGLLRKKYQKEANIFHIALSKAPFLRRFSIDLFKARQFLSSELNRIFKGGIRDFNGGILSKQQEVFHELCSSFKELSSHESFLLENFFYSLTPPLSQTLIMPSILKMLFNMMLKAINADYTHTSIFYKTQVKDEFFLIMIASPFIAIKEKIVDLVNKLCIPPSDLCHTQVSIYDTHCIGYIYRRNDQTSYQKLCSTFDEFLQQDLSWLLSQEKLSLN